jgi:hypothetical protein
LKYSRTEVASKILGRLADKHKRDIVPFQTPSSERGDVVAGAVRTVSVAMERCRNSEENMGTRSVLETHDSNGIMDKFQVAVRGEALRTFDNTLQPFLDPLHRPGHDEVVLVAVPVGWKPYVDAAGEYGLLAVPASSWQLDTDIAFAAAADSVRIVLVAAFAAKAFAFRGTEASVEWMVGMGLWPAAETTC